MKMTYTEQLKHPKWQKRRLEVLAHYDFACGHCSDSEKPLHVHHKLYVKGRMVWEYEDHHLIALCESCHEQWHVERSLIDQIISEIGAFQALGVLAGYGFSGGYLTGGIATAAYKIAPLEFVSGYAASEIEKNPEAHSKAHDDMKEGHLEGEELHLFLQKRAA